MVGEAMKVGIVGLGLIGGSAAKAFSAVGCTVYAYDVDKTVVGYAQIEGTVTKELTDRNIASCELLLLAATPQAVIGYLKENAHKIAPSTMVVDFCGTKRLVCQEGFALARKYGFTFVGAHPMAGLQYSGYKYSRANLFNGASLIVVPPVHDDIEMLSRVKELLSPLLFKKFVVTTADFHDRMMAYTSQMCHVVSNAFVKSPLSQYHKGYSAGSFRDLTRVARLNERMWTELFLENRENLLDELDTLIASLTEYRKAIADGDATELHRLLHEGCIAKEKSEA